MTTPKGLPLPMGSAMIRDRHVQLDDLQRLGFTDHTKDKLRRAVAYQGRTFREGRMESDLSQPSLGSG